MKFDLYVCVKLSHADRHVHQKQQNRVRDSEFLKKLFF
jgi:hypothetical protein